MSVLNFDDKLSMFLYGAQGVIDKATRPGSSPSVLKAVDGNRYVKLVCLSGTGEYAWGFIDKTNGDVLKSATYKAPAKGYRGNIFNSDNGLANVGPYGPGNIIKK